MLALMAGRREFGFNRRQAQRRRPIDNLVQTMYIRARHLDQASIEALDMGALSSLAARKAVDAVRGYMLGRLYGACGNVHFRAPRVRIRNPRHFDVGNYVSLERDTVIDAYSEHGVVLGDHVTVGQGSLLVGSGVVREPGVGVIVGGATSVGAYNALWGQGGLSLGRNCLLGPFVAIHTEN